MAKAYDGRVNTDSTILDNLGIFNENPSNYKNFDIEEPFETLMIACSKNLHPDE